MLPEREIQIGARLRAFREMLQIPRTKFAVTIGFGGERLAAYEAGRARLPYAVFQAIASRYALHPRWLAEGEGSPQVKNSFDDRPFAAALTRHALFTEIYDRHLAPRLTRTVEKAGADAAAAVALLNRASSLLQQMNPTALSAAQRKKLARFNAEQTRLIRQLRAELGLRDAANARAAELTGGQI
jgi:transcriptional regulator with XRE-family HTH domain